MCKRSSYRSAHPLNTAPQRRLPLRGAFLLVCLCALTLASGQTRPRLALIAPESPEGAAIVVPSSLEEQAASADVIVFGRVASVRSRVDGGTIVTDVTLSVEGTLKGGTRRDVTLALPGGRVGDLEVFAGGTPSFLPTERVLLFLKDRGSLELVRRWQSKYSLAGADAVQLESHTRLPIAEVEARLGAALARPSRIGGEPDAVTVQAFTTFCPAWPASVMPVVFEVNAAGAGNGAPAAGPAFLRLVYDSWHSWQALSNSYPSFSAGGVTSARNGTDHFDRFNTVAWAPLETGVLGENWCATQSGVRIDSDTRLSRAYAWDADASNGVSGYSLQAVLEHELGHGLGLGHSNGACDGGASTPLMCPAIAAGVRKTILADDQAGAASLYGLSGSPPGAPGSLIASAGGGANTLGWSASSGSLRAYDIERSSGGCSGGFRSVQTVAAGTLSYVDNDFGAGLTGSHCYRVKAIGTGGDSAYSNAHSTATAAVLKGDADSNGIVNMSDAQLVARCVLNLVSCAGVNQAAADVDCTSSLAMSDSLLIARKALNLIASFPC